MACEISGVWAYNHLIDWFHITMRITVLRQQIKGLEAEQPQFGQDTAQELNSIKHLLWHGNTFQALQRLEGLLLDLEFPETPSELTRKVAKGVGEFETYIRNNEEFIPNFGERRRNGECISTAFVESTVNQVISKRMVKKQSMQWTQRGAHLLLQIRTTVPPCSTTNSMMYFGDGIPSSVPSPRDPRVLSGLPVHRL